MKKNNGLLFLGTGSSSSIPMLHHTLLNPTKDPSIQRLYEEPLEEELTSIEDLIHVAVNNILKIDHLKNYYLKKKYAKLKTKPSCYTCFDALNENSPNRRNNISVLLKWRNSYVLIDVGKTFRDSILRNRDQINFKNFNLEKILITHSHTDAMGGLDDLRDIQIFKKVTEGGVVKYLPPTPIKVYLNEVAFERLQKSFFYLIEKDATGKKGNKAAILHLRILKDPKYNTVVNEQLNGTGSPKSSSSSVKSYDSRKSHTAEKGKKEIYKEQKSSINENQQIIEYNRVDKYGYAYTTFGNNIKIRFIPVEHGKDYICVGYIIGNENKIVYISDVSHISESTLHYIEQNGPIDILIIDALLYSKKYSSHLTLQEAIEYSLKIKPKKVYFVGMTCEIEHNIINMYLKKLSEKYGNISFELAYDGLFIPFDY